MNNNMNECQLKMFITEVSFALDDLALYLNTHPTCKEALACYHNYRKMRMQAMEDYTCRFGPLNKYQVNDENYFDWIEKPWPWEKECEC